MSRAAESAVPPLKLTNISFCPYGACGAGDSWNVAKSPLVQNSTIGTTIQMDYTVALGETVTIDTLTQTVYNNAGDNLLPVTSGDLATFQLSPAPQAPFGQNEVFVSFSEATDDSAARLRWQNRYVGI